MDDPIALARHLAPVMKALSDENRLAILLAVAERDCSVTELTAVTGLSQTLVSHHLKTLRDNGLVSVTAQPGGQVLSPTTLTTVTATTTLAFDVVVQDSGGSQEVQIPVTLTIDRPQGQGGPITKTQSIDVINPGESKTLTFGNLGQVPFASQVTVDVASVPGETNVANNSATYQVIFSLP